MQGNESKPDTTLYGPDGSELPESGATSAQDEADWRDLGRQIERLLRRDVARLVGTEEADDWSKIKDALVGRVRGQAEAVDTGEIGKRVEEIGRKVEEQLRAGMTQATGAGRDADWSTIARTVRERVEHSIDPSKLPFPGGSGMAAGAEDASVPAAPPSADKPPVPASAGGDDSGLPTVTKDVDAPPARPPLGRTLRPPA